MPLISSRGSLSSKSFGQFNDSGAGPVFVEDVFSTYLYTGNGSTQTITNGIDLSGKGGLVWTKFRSGSFGSESHALIDTVRGINKYIISDATNGEISSYSDVLTAFGSSGYTLGADASSGKVNYSSQNYASWTFRKAAKFFDVVTWTGTGANRTISHNLGVAPGMIMVKRTDTTGDWQVYHRSLSNTEYLVLNTDAAKATGTDRWNSTTATSTNFSLGTNATVNASGGTYVAYVFAHDDAASGIIQCGSISHTNGSNTTISLGWEPQYIMFKSASGTADWYIYDTLRGMCVASSNGTDLYVVANTSAAESSNDGLSPSSTGFIFSSGQSTGTYVYVAIRRGPMRVPTDATKVFTPQAVSQADTIDSTGIAFPPDLINTFSRTGTDRTQQYNIFNFTDRLRGLSTPNNTFVDANRAYLLVSSSSAAEYSISYVQLKSDGQNITRSVGWNSSSYGNHIYYFFRRAQQFFDAVFYVGTGSARTVSHNLGYAPELIFVKKTNDVGDWQVYAGSAGEYLVLNSTAAKTTGNTDRWNNTSPTSSNFSVGTSTNVNGSGASYIAYLFSSCPGVSKVGTFTGNGSSQNIDCGFAGGARFVLIKRTDSTGDWYVWDTARGIVTSTDPHLSLNSTAAEVTTDDSIDPLNAGFTVNQVTATNINVTSATYLYLAIA